MPTEWVAGSTSSLPRAIIRAALSGELDAVPTRQDPNFGFAVPTACPEIDNKLLSPREMWKDPAEYDRSAAKLAAAFRENQRAFDTGLSPEVKAAAPRG